MLTVQVLEAGVADDRFVFAFSDANFERYGLTAQDGKPAQLFFFRRSLAKQKASAKMGFICTPLDNSAII